ncbi:cell division protein FtsA [Buchnera aphidicola]|uniref:cell division protein FtsA n=1 Tax=Buchnera aphidicola TaxID=9 RepID=UPI00346475E1
MIKKNKKILVGLEIGTTKVSVLVGEMLPDGMINIIGIGNCPSKGIDKGSINDLQAIIFCIKKAIQEAEKMAKYNISSVYLALSNKYINYTNEIGIVPISKNEITQHDVKYAIYTAQSIKLNHSYHILHTIPQEYSIDQENGIKNPIGLSGIRMKAKLHLITCREDLKQNFIKALKICNIKIKQIIFSGLASSEAVLTEEEKKSGVCLIDIGGGSIDIIIYINNSIQHSQVIPYAGNTITNDIAHVFNISFQNAEKIKLKYGSTMLSPLSISKKIIEISNIHEYYIRKIQKETLIEVIESRYEELLNIVNKNIIKIQEKLYYLKKPYLLGSGIVITGGSSQMKYLESFAEKIFNMQVRIGNPIKITTHTDFSINPSYSTTVGLLRYGSNEQNNYEKNINKYNIFTKYFQFFKKWIKKYSKLTYLYKN